MTGKINEAGEQPTVQATAKRRRVPLWLWIAAPLLVAGFFG